MDDWEIVRGERLDFADLLESLPPDRFEAQSLCAGWRVRDVAGHVISLARTTFGQMLPLIVRNRFDVDRMLSRLAVDQGRARPQELVGTLRACAGSRVRPPGVRTAGVWTDVLVHAQDVRRPLGLTREFPEERLRLALEEAARTRFVLGAKHRIRGLKLVAADVCWTRGDGPALEGPAEALLLAVCGRRVALDDLSGEGVHVLRSRV